MCGAAGAYLVLLGGGRQCWCYRYNVVEQVSEPAVGDVVKIKFQHQVCKGVLAEVGTPRAMKSREEAFLRGGVHTLLR